LAQLLHVVWIREIPKFHWPRAVTALSRCRRLPQ